jgi:2-phosphosulfolactate phosphatase
VGLHGLLTLQSASDAVVIIDVLSFSTTVDIAASNGASVFPYRWKDDSVLAGGRSNEGKYNEDKYTLSPASLRSIPRGTALAVPGIKPT